MGFACRTRRERTEGRWHQLEQSIMGLSKEQVEQHIAGVKKRLTNEKEVGLDGVRGLKFGLA